MSFELEFLFSENEYFSNKSLSKVYMMRAEPDETDPLSFEGPEIIKCTGCKIDWKKGKDVTVKVIKKRQKHKSKGSVRTIEKKVKADSFFNFFDPPIVPTPDDGVEEMDEETEALLAADFEIGHFFRDRIIPRAVLYFTGEALEDEDDDYEEEGDEEGQKGRRKKGRYGESRRATRVQTTMKVFQRRDSIVFFSSVAELTSCSLLIICFVSMIARARCNRKDRRYFASRLPFYHTNNRRNKRDHDDPIAFLIFAFFFCATNYVNFLSFSKNSMH